MNETITVMQAYNETLQELQAGNARVEKQVAALLVIAELLVDISAKLKDKVDNVLQG